MTVERLGEAPDDEGLPKGRRAGSQKGAAAGPPDLHSSRNNAAPGPIRGRLTLRRVGRIHGWRTDIDLLGSQAGDLVAALKGQVVWVQHSGRNERHERWELLSTPVLDKATARSEGALIPVPASIRGFTRKCREQDRGVDVQGQPRPEKRR